MVHCIIMKASNALGLQHMLDQCGPSVGFRHCLQQISVRSVIELGLVAGSYDGSSFRSAVSCASNSNSSVCCVVRFCGSCLKNVKFVGICLGLCVSTDTLLVIGLLCSLSQFTCPAIVHYALYWQCYFQSFVKLQMVFKNSKCFNAPFAGASCRGCQQSCGYSLLPIKLLMSSAKAFCPIPPLQKKVLNSYKHFILGVVSLMGFDGVSKIIIPRECKILLISFSFQWYKSVWIQCLKAVHFLRIPT